jgi:hypothetical protein
MPVCSILVEVIIGFIPKVQKIDSFLLVRDRFHTNMPRTKKTGWHLFVAKRNPVLKMFISGFIERQLALSTEWHSLTEEEREEWNVCARRTRLSGWNLFVKEQYHILEGIPFDKKMCELGIRWGTLTQSERDMWNTKGSLPKFEIFIKNMEDLYEKDNVFTKEIKLALNRAGYTSVMEKNDDCVRFRNLLKILEDFGYSIDDDFLRGLKMSLRVAGW